MALTSTRGEDYVNDESVELNWAKKTFEHAEIYFSLLCAVSEPGRLTLTQLDDEIYTRFREEFPDFKVDLINEDEMKSAESKQKWRPFCESYKGRIEDYNFGTLLRIDCHDEYSEKNTTLVPKVQFLAIEIARNREGFNTGLGSKFPTVDGIPGL